MGDLSDYSTWDSNRRFDNDEVCSIERLESSDESRMVGLTYILPCGVYSVTRISLFKHDVTLTVRVIE
jgi:hypothetical protein